jgi:hypothetical protein
MREVLTFISLALLLAALIFCGCAREASVASRSRLAVSRSNQEAKRLYHVEPFKEEHGQWRSEGQEQIWEALTSSGGHDMTAKVIFDRRGSVVSAHVQMLAYPGPERPTNLFKPIGPEMLGKGRLTIPEVMPK